MNAVRHHDEAAGDWNGPGRFERAVERQRRLSGLLLVFAVLPAVLGADTPAPLAERHQRWLEEVEVLLSPAERQAFESIAEEYRRDLFMERFWRSRDPHPETPRNEFRDQWEERLAVAERRFGTLDDLRAQVLLLFGEPVAVARPRCGELLRPLEIWTVQVSGAPSSAPIVFVRSAEAGGGLSAWWAALGLEALTTTPSGAPAADPDVAWQRIRRRCHEGPELVDRLLGARPLPELSRQVLPARDEGWLSLFLDRSTDLEADARRLDAALDVTFPTRDRGHTVVEMRFEVDRKPLVATGASGDYRFVLDGEVLRRDSLLESFRYRFEIPSVDAADDTLELVAHRHLRPGAYSVSVRLENLDTQSFFRTRREIEVPIVAPAEPDGGEATGGHSLTLLEPPPGLHTGRLRVEARLTGVGVDKVAFELDGKRLMSKRRPPWSIEVDLGRAPRLHLLRAVALSERGEVLAEDRIQINAGPQNFEVRLLEPRSGGSYGDQARARAVVDVPRGQRLDRVELFRGEDRLATLYQPPFVHTIPLPDTNELTYVRAVAYLDDGHSTESLAFVNSPAHLDRLEVDLVELYTTVVDRKGRPVERVRPEDFTVLENETPQRILRFEQASDRPFHAAVLIDTSTSMAEELRRAEKAALAFFDNIVTPRDRAAVVTFSDQPRLVVPFTNDLEVLAGGLAQIEADGETALHDSVVFTLYHFGGLKGQRALILLSDGEDSVSRYSFEETLDFARATGVAIFTIGLDIASRAHEARAKLIRLGQETGGRHFFISRTSELERVYSTIENELRSQYLLAYQSSLEGDSYRSIEVRLSDPSLEAKTIAGYDP